MSTTTDLKFCCACGKYKAYRDGMCFGCHAEVERLQREFNSADTVNTLAALPNPVRHGIDATPSAVERAHVRHPELDIALDDAMRFRRDEANDAIVCDRLVHSVSDIELLLENLVDHLAHDGRIFLTCYNYIWEAVIRAGETMGFKLPTPPANWLSESDLENLFTLVGLEVVKYEDRLLLPMPVPGVSTLLNRYVAKLPGMGRGCVYRLYVLRRRAETRHRPATPPSVTVVVPARNEEGNVPNIIARTPKLGARTELIFVEGGSTDNTRAAIEAANAAYEGDLELSLYPQTGKGKGDAVRLGFGAARGEVLVILDSDMGVAPEDLPSFVNALARGHAEFVNGSRLVYPMAGKAMRFLNLLANKFFAALFSWILMHHPQRPSAGRDRRRGRGRHAGAARSQRQTRYACRTPSAMCWPT